MYTTVRLVKIERDQSIAREECPDFYRNVQLGVLLALKEEGILTEMQCRNAEEALKRQLYSVRREWGSNR